MEKKTRSRLPITANPSHRCVVTVTGSHFKTHLERGHAFFSRAEVTVSPVL